MKIIRKNGAIGALLDEYERAIFDLQASLDYIHGDELTSLVDEETSDPDCKTLQSILTHVVRAGYGYIILIRKHLGEDIEYKERELLNSTEAYKKALHQMFVYNEQFFRDYPNVQLESYDPDEKFKTSWGQLYDVEQLMEHAIVHVLRHRRQIILFLNEHRIR